MNANEYKNILYGIFHILAEITPSVGYKLLITGNPKNVVLPKINIIQIIKALFSVKLPFGFAIVLFCIFDEAFLALSGKNLIHKTEQMLNKI